MGFLGCLKVGWIIAKALKRVLEWLKWPWSGLFKDGFYWVNTLRVPRKKHTGKPGIIEMGPIFWGDNHIAK